MHTRLEFELELPKDFRPVDMLDFHRRDSQEVAERVSTHGLHKALLWQGQPACLAISFKHRQAQVSLALGAPGAAPATAEAEARTPAETALRRLARRMLALDQDLAGFTTRFADHPQLGPLLARQPGLRVPATATPFEALAWAITGQQISVPVAVSLRRKLIQACNLQHASGLLCHPDAAQTAALSPETLRAAGFSASKTSSLLRMAQQVADGELPLDHWASALDADRVRLIRERLLAIKGIGPWTVNYALLRGFGWLDGSLHGDVAVRRGLQNLLGAAAKPDERTTEKWLAQFSPWRALVAAHLWASLTATSD